MIGIESRWERVFRANGKQYKNCLEENKKIYFAVKEKEYENLESCVEYAISHQHHAAFVHFFLNKAKFSKQYFLEKLQEYIGITEDANIEAWKNYKIVHDVYWRSPEFDYEENIENIENVYKQSLLYQWINGGVIPGRSAIIQIGFYLCLNSTQVDELLIYAGHSKLYVLDIPDVIAKYYLDLYASNHELSAMEKICIVKKRMNKELKDNFNLDENSLLLCAYRKNNITKAVKNCEEKNGEQIWELKNIIDKLSPVYESSDKDVFIEFEKVSDELYKKYNIKKTGNSKDKYNLYFEDFNVEWNSARKQLFQYVKQDLSQVIASAHELGWDINDEIDILKKNLDEEKAGKCMKDIGDTQYLTKFFTYRLDEVTDEESFTEFLDKAKKETLQSVFKDKYYGFFRKTYQYIIENEDFKKNLYYSNCPMVYSKQETTTLEKVERQGSYINSFCKRYIMDENKKNMKNDKKKRKAHIKLLADIWLLPNALEEECYNGEINTAFSSKYNKITNLIEGRNKKDVTHRIEDKGKEKSNAYIMDMAKKTDLIKFCIAAGKEDDIEKYLQYAGLCMKQQEGSGESDKLKKDKTDILVEYALMYRDKLIDKWCSSNKNGNLDIASLKKRMKDSFPFIKLLMTINRDIQLVMKDIEPKSMEKIHNNLESMIYPVKSGMNKWFEGDGEGENKGYNKFYDKDRSYRLKDLKNIK